MRTNAPKVGSDASALYDFCNNATESHLFGKTATRKTIALVREITKREEPCGLYLFCFRTKADMEKAHENAASTDSGLNPRYQKATAGEISSSEVSPYVFCTPNKLCTLLVRLGDDISTVAWIVIDGWDRYNPNEFAAFGLIRMYRGDNKFRLVLASVSQYAELPVFKAAVPWRRMGVPSPSIRVEYTTEHPGNVASNSATPGKTVIFYPGADAPPFKGNILFDSFPFRDTDASVVVDSVKDRSGRPITKHVAELRADSIDSGLVKRCIRETAFQALRENTPPRYRKGLDRTIVYLTSLNVSVNTLFPKDHGGDVQAIIRMMNTYGVNPKTARYIIWSKLGLQAGMFFQFWYRSYPVEMRERELYIGCLAACLLDLPPSSYAPAAAYAQFKGRNDMETMCNMWDSLTFSVKLGDFNKHRVIIWAKSKGFYIDPVIQLVLRFIRIHLSNAPNSQFNEARFLVTTFELNNIESFVTPVYGVDTKTKNWNTSEALPNQQAPGSGGKGVAPVHMRGNVLLMYFNHVKLTDPPPRPPPEDNSDVMSLRPDLFK